MKVPFNRFVALLAVLLHAASAFAQPSTAFFYGSHPPVAALADYDWVVLDADNAQTDEWQALRASSTVYCYLSVGEAEQEVAATHRNLVIGDNPGWQSAIMDVRAPAWHNRLSEKALELTQRGCEGLFLDTLDSYQLALDKSQWAAAEAGMAQVVQSFAEALPETDILLNRGFEIYSRVSSHVTGMVVESLFQGWNAANRQFVEISDEERAWLSQQTAPVVADNHPVIVIDYLPLSASDEERLALAGKIVASGFIPWVTDPTLVHLGVSKLAPLPREIALLYHPHETDFAGHDAHGLVGAVLDYYGYNLRPYDVSKGLPELVKGWHAGALIWFDGADLDAAGVSAREWNRWFQHAIDSSFPFAMVGALPPIERRLLSRMGLDIGSASGTALKVDHVGRGYGDFEAPPPETEQVWSSFANRSEANRPWITLADGRARVAPVLTGPWGGYAQHPFVLEQGFGHQRRWKLNPFLFIKTALRIPDYPMPDVTTENGRRILLSHVDGDGFPSRAEIPGTPFASEVLLERVFRPIDIPHTVSIVEGEIAETGLYPDLSPVLEPLAREIFALPNVELASHTFSHPFFWARRGNIDTSKTLYGLGLPIEGYETDFAREIAGSIAYIDEKLAPPGKRTKVMLWSGDAVADADIVGIAEAVGVVNLNGGNTQIRDALPSFTNVSAQSKWTAKGYQIYAPIMNENVYTNDWTGPFHGFRRVIETFKRTEDPRRLKPFNIYYHFYSGTKPGALTALLEIYDYVLSQPRTGMFISEYAHRVRGFHQAQIRWNGDQWRITNAGALRTLRLPESLGVPQPAESEGIAGYVASKDGTYVHLAASDATLVLADTPGKAPFLQEANGMVLQWRYEGASLQLRISGYEPLEMVFGNAEGCQLNYADQRLSGRREEDGVHFALPVKDTGPATLSC